MCQKQKQKSKHKEKTIKRKNKKKERKKNTYLWKLEWKTAERAMCAPNQTKTKQTKKPTEISNLNRKRMRSTEKDNEKFSKFYSKCGSGRPRLQLSHILNCLC